MPPIPDPNAPLGEWPDFTECQSLSSNFFGEPTTKLVTHQSAGGTQGENFALIHNGRHILFLHHFHETYLVEKPHEQDVWSNWTVQTALPVQGLFSNLANQPLNWVTTGQYYQMPIPQISRWNQANQGEGVWNPSYPAGAQPQAFYHTDTTDGLKHPLTGKWLIYHSIRPGILDDSRIGPYYTNPGTYGTISVSTRDSDPVADSPWNQSNVSIFDPDTLSWWEQPWMQEESPGVFKANGSITEPNAIFVPHPHPTQPWPNGFIRLFYRCVQPANLGTGTGGVPYVGSGQFTWMTSYMDSEDGLTGWVKPSYAVGSVEPSGTIWDPDEGAASPFWNPRMQVGPTGVTFAWKWAQPFLQGGFSERGNMQQGVAADPAADGCHLVGKVSVANTQISPPPAYYRGCIAHYFSPDWGDTWFESKQSMQIVEPESGQTLTWTGVVAHPGRQVEGGREIGVPPGGYYRTPSLLIDDDYPQYEGGTGGRYLLHMSGGQNVIGTGSPELAWIATASRPVPNPPVPAQDLGSARIVNKTDQEREGICWHRIPLPNIDLWGGAEPTITVTDAEETPGTQRCQIYEHGPFYTGTTNPMYVRVTYKAHLDAGISDPDFSVAYTNYREKVVTFDTSSTAGSAWAQHADVDLANTTFTLTIPFASGNQVLTFDLDDFTTEYQQERTTGNEVARLFRHFEVTNNAAPEPLFFGKLILWVPDNQRVCHFWLHWGNGMAGQDATQSERPETHFEVAGNVTLTVSGGGSELTIYGEDMKLPLPVSESAGTYTATLVAPVNNNGRNVDAWDSVPHGWGHAYFGKLSYTGGSPTALETSSVAAEQASHLESVSLAWQDLGTFGPTQVLVKRPENSLITTDLEGRVQCARHVQAWRNSHNNWWWPAFREPLGCVAFSGSTGGQPEFGAQKLHMLARSGQPDYEFLRLNVFQETLRYFHWYESDGTPLQINDRSGSSGYYTDLYFWNGRPFFLNNYIPQSLVVYRPSPPYSDSLGLGGSLNKFIYKTPRELWASAQGPVGDGWDGYNNEHWGGMTLCHYASLTGDPLAMELVEHNTTAALAQTLGFYDESEPGNCGGQATITGNLQGRAAGRIMITLCANYYVTGDPWIPASLNARAAAVFDGPVGFASQSVACAGLTGWLGHNKPRSTVRIFGNDSTGFTSGKQVNTWQQAILAYGFYCSFLLTGNPFYNEVAREICYAITMHCVRRRPLAGARWEQPCAADWRPYGQGSEGTPIDEDDWYATNPLTGFPYMLGVCAGTETWPRALYILGYIYAGIENNDEWRDRCFELIRDIIRQEDKSLTRGPYGWGPLWQENSDYEWLAFEEDPFRTRTTSGNYSVSVDATFAGLNMEDGDIQMEYIGTTPPPTRTITDVDATFAGLTMGDGDILMDNVGVGSRTISMDASFRGLNMLNGDIQVVNVIDRDIEVSARFEGLSMTGWMINPPIGGRPTNWVGR